MLAKCPHCGKTILIENWGKNFCKYCNREVFISDPSNPAPPVDDVSVEFSVKRNLFLFFKDVFIGIIKSPGNFFRNFQYEEKEGRYLFYYGMVLVTFGLVIYFQVEKLSLLIIKSIAKGDSGLPNFLSSQLKFLKKNKIDIRFFDISTLFSPIFSLFFIYITRGILFTVKTFKEEIKDISEFKLNLMEVNFVTATSFTSWAFITLPIFGIFYSIYLFYKGMRIRLKFSIFQTVLSLILQLTFINFLLSSWMWVYKYLFK